jgi:hypothetical protein
MGLDPGYCGDLQRADLGLASLAWVMTYWVEGVDVAFGERREDDLPRKITGVCVRPRRDLMRLSTASAGTPLVGSVKYSWWARHDFLAQPVLHGSVALEQGAHDFADRGIGAGLDLALDGISHVE